MVWCVYLLPKTCNFEDIHNELKITTTSKMNSTFRNTNEMPATETEIEEAAKYLLEKQIHTGFKIWHFKPNHDLRRSYSGFRNFEWALVWKRYHELFKEEVKRIGSNREILDGHEELERKQV